MGGVSVAPQAHDQLQRSLTAAHGYIQAKRGTPDGLRVVPADDPLRIMGESMAGALAVPCMAADGTLSTLQLIPPPDVAKRLADAGLDTVGGTPEELAAYQKSEITKWAKVVKDSGAKAD